ncbi:hypothetical protein BV898_13051 [Hypsibius exemplaris]|uniref:Uncharacterized protein n=1 Tax=Hypsibius exemplaris TaxID=2072580 RepID=A0A1W0WBZ3_HYPEX|nr:hypothetical protein BV898_13051 [Hypsibius exemplaris]
MVASVLVLEDVVKASIDSMAYAVALGIKGTIWTILFRDQEHGHSLDGRTLKKCPLKKHSRYGKTIEVVAAEMYKNVKILEAQDVAIVYSLSAPAHVNIDELTITPLAPESI